MIDFVFDSPLPVGVVLTIAGLLLVGSITLEIFRRSRFLIVRLLCILLLFISLLCLVLRPAFFGTSEGKWVLVLTKNYSPSQADSLIRARDLEVVVLRGAESYRGFQQVSLNELEAVKERIAIVMGDGIPRSFLAFNPEVTFLYVPSKKHNGIARLDVPRIHAGQAKLVQGLVHDHPDTMVVTWVGPGGAEDSVVLQPGQSTFLLKLRPKQAGLFTYQVNSRSSDFSSSELVPVEVLPTRKLSILVLQSFPTFEMRQLKDYLRAQGHAVTIRHQVSKGTYRFEYANTENQSFSRITAEMLDRFDLLIASQGEAESLATHELISIENAVQNGLGVLFLLQVPSVKPALNKVFPLALQKIQSDSIQLSHFLWNESLALHSIPARVAESATTHSIWADSKDRVVTGYAMGGLGKVGFQLLDQTYQLALEGDDKKYALLWSSTIEEMARATNSTFRIRISQPPPYFAREALHLEIVSAGATPTLMLDGENLPLREDEIVDDVWSTHFWIDRPGWHSLLLQDSSSLPFYVHDSEEVSSLATFNTMQENLVRHLATSKNSAPIHMRKEIPRIWFFITLLLSAGFLWLSPKL